MNRELPENWPRPGIVIFNASIFLEAPKMKSDTIGFSNINIEKNG